MEEDRPGRGGGARTASWALPLCWVTAEVVRRPAARTPGTSFPLVHS